MLKRKMQTDIEILERANASYQLKINDMENEFKKKEESANALVDENGQQQIRIFTLQDYVNAQKIEHLHVIEHVKTLEGVKYEFDRKLASQIDQCDYQHKMIDHL